jgi:hypothetical protein
MQIKRNWLAGALFAAALGVLILASSGSAHSLATCTPNTSGQLDTAVHNASCTTIVLKVSPAYDPGVTFGQHAYYTDFASSPANGFEVDHPVLITGPTNSSGNCTAMKTTVVDGDQAPGGVPGSNGPVFTVESDNVQFKCFTARYGTAGISSDGFDGLNVNQMNLQSNGRDQTGGAPNGDGVWVNDGDNVVVKNSTIAGQGFDGIESDVTIPTVDSNSGWVVKKNTMTNIHNSCADLSENTATTIGELVSGKPANGISCSVSGTNDVDPAIYVADQGVGVVAADANKVYASTVLNSHRSCFDIEGIFAQFLSNNCITSQSTAGMGVYLAGDNIKADSFSTTLSSGHTGATCVLVDGNLLKLTNVKCGASRDMGIVVNGDDATVTNVQVRQSKNVCLEANGNHQTWLTASCGQVTGGAGGEYGLWSTGNTGGSPSKFTSITIGDVNDTCFQADNPGETFSKISCHGSSNGKGISANNGGNTFDGFDIGTSYDACAADESDGFGGNTFKNGHCARVVNDAAVWGTDTPFTINNVKVDAAFDDCFAYYDGGNAVDGTLTNSVGKSCGTGASAGNGAEWLGVGTNTITGNDLGQSPAESLLVSVIPTGSTYYTVNNNKFHDSLDSDCVNIAIVDRLTFTGNKAQGCLDSAFSFDVNEDPIVSTNTGIDASGLFGGGTMEVFCEVTCDGSAVLGGGIVNGNKLDAGGNEADGLHIENLSGGTGLKVTTNTITNMSGIGIHLPPADTGGNTLSGNTVLNAGDVDDTTFGIFIESDGNTLLKSNVSGSFDNGIEIAGDNNTLGDGTSTNSNQSHDNGEDGTHIASTADSTSLDTNNTKNNSGEGTEDDGTNTTITNNTSSGNRQDCAGTDGSGNYDPAPAGCADGSYFTDAGIILKPVHVSFGSIF